MKATPILVVESVESSRQFFCEALGFEIVVEVPDGELVAFTLLQSGGAEIMLQSNASVRQDIAGEHFHSIVYVDVPDVVATRDRVAHLETVVPLRTTFYGTTELFVREPGGNVVGLSSPTKSDDYVR